MNQHTDFKAAALNFETRAYIDGKFGEAASGRIFPTINPATGRVITEVSACGEEDVNRTVVAASRAFEAGNWSRMAPGGRKAVLLKFAQPIKANIDELALLETLNAGKPISDVRSIDLPDSIATLRWHAEATDKIYDQMSTAPHDVVSMIVREPIGMVGAVIACNFPLFVAMWKIGPALVGGNSLIIKPAELTSISLLRVAQLASEAGIPGGVFNVLPGLGHEAGNAIGLHMDCVSFTGSGEVGRYFLEHSAKSNMKRNILECVGKSPAIVMGDVKELSPVVEDVAAGILFCVGENCSAGSRLIVQEGIKDRLLDELKTQLADWKVGDPFDESTKVGAMIEERHLEKVLGLIERGKEEGAQATLGGNRVLEETGGFLVEPTIFEGVTNDMTIAREATFGPVHSVISVKTEEEAVQIANDTNYGLAASLHTDDLNTAHRAAKAVRAGTVSVNCYSKGDFTVPFGGYKESGSGGKDKGLHAHDQYTEQKAIRIQLR